MDYRPVEFKEKPRLVSSYLEGKALRGKEDYQRAVASSSQQNTELKKQESELKSFKNAFEYTFKPAIDEAVQNKDQALANKIADDLKTRYRDVIDLQFGGNFSIDSGRNKQISGYTIKSQEELDHFMRDDLIDDLSYDFYTKQFDNGENVNLQLTIDRDKGVTELVEQLVETPLGFKDIQSIRKEIGSDKQVQTFNIIDTQFSKMKGVYNQYLEDQKVGGAAANASKSSMDQVLITLFGKMLDPGSVVRESEYARTTKGLKIATQIKGWKEKISKGGEPWTDAEREHLLRVAERMKEEAGIKIGEHTSQYFYEADKYNIPYEQIGLDKYKIYRAGEGQSQPNETEPKVDLDSFISQASIDIGRELTPEEVEIAKKRIGTGGL